MKLNEIASVKTGLVLHRKESKEAGVGYEYRQLNLKSVLDNGVINFEDVIKFYTSEKLPENYLTQSGDVIIKTSEPYTALYITEEYTGLVIPSHFVIVRPDKTKALSKYIAWYMNKERIKKAFRMSCMGTLKQIRPSTIAQTEIKLPALERQQQVIDLYDISRSEIELLEKLISQKKIYYKALINKINRM